MVKYSFSDWSYLLTEGSYITVNSNPAEFRLSTDWALHSSSVYAPINLSDDNNLIVYARFKFQGANVLDYDRAAIFIKTGSTYYIMGFFHVGGQLMWYRRTATSRLDRFTSATLLHSVEPMYTNSWYWIAMWRDSAGNIRYYAEIATDLNKRPELEDMRSLSSLNHSVSVENVYEFGTVGLRLRDGNLLMDDMGVDDLDAVMELSLGTAEIISYEAVHAPAAKGYGTIMISDPLLANYATILTNMKTMYTIKDETYGNSFLTGEIESVQIVNKDVIALTISNNAIKTIKQACNYDQVLYSNLMKFVQANKMLDHIDDIPTGLTGYAISAKKKSLTSMTIYPAGIVYDHNPISGDPESLYQEDVLLDFGIDEDYEEDYTEFEFWIYVTDKTDISKLILNLKYEIIADSGGYNLDPYWGVYESGGWNVLYIVEDEETKGKNDDINQLSHLSVLPMDLFSISDLLVSLDGGTPNSSGYKKYEFKIRFWSGKRSIFARDHRYAFDIVQLTVETDGVDQPVTVGQGLIAAASDVDGIVFDTSPAWDITGFPASEGFGEGDQYYVTKWLDDILVEIFTNADTEFAYSQDITDIENQVIFTDVLTFDYIYEVLETVKKTLNAPWWINPENRIIRQVSIDNQLSTGLTLINGEDGDFIDDMDGISYIVDGRNIRTNATVIGKNDITNPADGVITPEYTLEGGNEEEIVVRTNILNPTALNKELETLIKLHTNAKISFIGTINYSSGRQNYSELALYKTVILTLYDGNGNEIISRTLTIVKLEYRNTLGTGSNELVKLWLEELIA